MNYFKSLLPVGIFALGVFTAGTANASLVTYSTNGVFDCNGIAGCVTGVNTASVNGFTVTYVNQGSTTVNANPIVSSNYGEIRVSGPNGGSVNLTNLLLTITLSQGSPVNAGSNQSWKGIANGTVSVVNGNSSGFATICFIANACPNAIESIVYNSVGGGTTTYKIQTPPNTNPPPANGYTIRATQDGSNFDPTSFQGSIQMSDTPETSTYLMMFSGLCGLGLLRRRR